MLRIEDLEEPGQILQPFSFGGDPVRIGEDSLIKAAADIDADIRGQVKGLNEPARRLDEGGSKTVQDADEQWSTIDRVRAFLSNAYPDLQEWQFEFIVRAIPDIVDSIEDIEEDTDETELRQSFPGNASQPERSWQDIYDEVREMIDRGPPRIP